MRYFIGFLITIGLLILLIVMLLRGGGDQKKVPETAKTLSSYAMTDAEVMLLEDGPVNAEGEHQQVRITVGRDTVVYEQLGGYTGTVVNRQNFENNPSSFAVFLKSLETIGFNKGDTSSSLRDERGQCPLGGRYVMELRQGSRSLQRFWATTCGSPRTYQGAMSPTLDLFRAQIPGYSDLAGNLDLD